VKPTRYIPVLLTLLVSACSTLPDSVESVVAPPANGGAAVTDSYEIIAGAAGGEFYRWAKHLNGEACYGHAVLVVEEIRPHPEWMSSLRLNLSSRDHKDWMSITLDFDPESEKLWLVTQAPPDHEPRVTDEGFDVGEKIYLTFIVTGQQVVTYAVAYEEIIALKDGVPRDRVAYPMDYDHDLETVSFVVSGAVVNVSELQVGVDCRSESSGAEPTQVGVVP